MNKISLFLVWASLVGANIAQADILFLDLNFSVNELEAVRQVAKNRNEPLFIYPQRSPADERVMAPQWRLTEELRSQLAHCLAQGTHDCSDLNRRYTVENEKMTKLIVHIKRIDTAELLRIFGEIAEQHGKISTFIISGHSGGTAFGGLFGVASLNEVQNAFAQNQQVVNSLHSILLWGCYSGTLNNLYNSWKKTFPTVQVLAGYEVRSPLGIYDESAIYLKSFLSKDASLRAATSVRKAHQIFRSVEKVAEVDGAALVGDYYMTYDEADSVAEMLKRCAKFPEPLLEKYRCYNNAQPGCENPPDDHQGPLRDFYTYLQVNRHCSELLSEQYRDIPTPERLIRLIYYGNVKKNFVTHHQEDLRKATDFLTALQYPRELAFENYFNAIRARNVEQQKLLSMHFNRRGLNDGSFAWNANQHEEQRLLFINFSIGRALLFPNFIGGMIEECTPFSWVDEGSAEPDKCGLTQVVKDPLDTEMERQLAFSLWFSRINYGYVNIDPVLMFDIPDGRGEQKPNFIRQMEKDISLINGINETYLSEPQKVLKVKYPQMLAEAKLMSDLELIQKLVRDGNEIVRWIDQQIAEATTNHIDESIIGFMKSNRTDLANKIIKLDGYLH